MTVDRDRMERLVEVWHRAAQDAVALLRSLDGPEWELPTDLPGWNVRAVAAHLAHVESVLAGNPQPDVEAPPAPHVRGTMGRITEVGPVARAAWSPTQIVDELQSSVAASYARLSAEPPDGAAPGPDFAGSLGWSWETLLSNRPLDLWMHEQDIRRAVGRPGGLDSPAAAHVATVFADSLPYVLAKRLGAPAGTTVVLEVTGAHPRTVAAAVTEEGRGVRLGEVPAAPSTAVRLEFECWITLAGGRRGADGCPAEVSGDTELGRRLLAQLAVTP